MLPAALVCYIYGIAIAMLICELSLSLILLGGVHRHGQDTLDISADLLELGQSSVAVVSSGVKSILDIPRTLEYLVKYHFGIILNKF